MAHALLEMVRGIASLTPRAPKTRDMVRKELIATLHEGIDLVTMLRTTRAVYRPRTHKLELFHDDERIMEIRTREHCQEWLDRLSQHNPILQVTLVPPPKPAKATR